MLLASYARLPAAAARRPARGAPSGCRLLAHHGARRPDQSVLLHPRAQATRPPCTARSSSARRRSSSRSSTRSSAGIALRRRRGRAPSSRSRGVTCRARRARPALRGRGAQGRRDPHDLGARVERAHAPEPPAAAAACRNFALARVTLLGGTAHAPPADVRRPRRDSTYGSLSAKSIGCILFLGVFTSVVSYLNWYFLLSRIGAVRCGMLLTLQPITTAILAWLLLDEPVTGQLVAGRRRRPARALPRAGLRGPGPRRAASPRTPCRVTPGRAAGSAVHDRAHDLKEHNARLAFEDELAGRAAVRNLPVWISLVTTTACNLRCIMCAQGEGMIPVVPMEEDVYQHGRDDALSRPRRRCSSRRSASRSCRRTCPRILADLRRYDVRLEIISNGTLLKERKILHDLVERAGTFTFSIDGATRETYNRIRLGGRLRRRDGEHPAVQPAPARDAARRAAAAHVQLRADEEHDRRVPGVHRPRGALPRGRRLVLPPARLRAGIRGRVARGRAASREPLPRGSRSSGRSATASSSTARRRSRSRRRSARRSTPPRRAAPEPPIPASRGARRRRRGLRARGLRPRPLARRAARAARASRGATSSGRRPTSARKGEVFTCCLANAVEIGNIRERPFQLIWNGPDLHRHAPAGLHRRPAPPVQGLLRDREERIDLASAWAATAQQSAAITA